MHEIVANLGRDRDFLALYWERLGNQFFAQPVSISIRRGEGGRNLLLLTADYADFPLVNFPRRISSVYWHSNGRQVFSCSFAKQQAAARRSGTADCEILLRAGSYNYW